MGNLYISLWVLNIFQGFYISSSFLSLLLYVPFLLISMYYTYLAFFYNSKNLYIKSLFLLLVLLGIYGILHIMFGEGYNLGNHYRDNREFLVGAFSSLMPIFASYVLTIKGAINEQTIRRWIVVFVLLSTMEYWSTYRDLAAQWEHVDAEQFTNNSGYSFLALAPLAFFLYRKPALQYALLAYLMYYVFISMKRGAIIIAILMLFWLMNQTLRVSSRKKKIIVFSLVCIFIIAAIFFIQEYYLTNDFFQARLLQTLEGNSSSRDSIYTSLLGYYFHEASFINVLLGSGADATIAIAGNLAHSDWIELAINCGLLGVVVYVVYWYGFYKVFKCLKRYPIPYAIFGACLLYTFIRSFFSMSYSMTPFYISLCIGYSVAQLEIYKPQKYVQ